MHHVGVTTLLRGLQILVDDTDDRAVLRMFAVRQQALMLVDNQQVPVLIDNVQIPRPQPVLATGFLYTHLHASLQRKVELTRPPSVNIDVVRQHFLDFRATAVAHLLQQEG